MQHIPLRRGQCFVCVLHTPIKLNYYDLNGDMSLRKVIETIYVNEHCVSDVRIQHVRVCKNNKKKFTRIFVDDDNVRGIQREQRNVFVHSAKTLKSVRNIYLILYIYLISIYYILHDPMPTHHSIVTTTQQF